MDPKTSESCREEGLSSDYLFPYPDGECDYHRPVFPPYPSGRVPDASYIASSFTGSATDLDPTPYNTLSHQMASMALAQDWWQELPTYSSEENVHNQQREDSFPSCSSFLPGQDSVYNGQYVQTPLNYANRFSPSFPLPDLPIVRTADRFKPLPRATPPPPQWTYPSPSALPPFPRGESSRGYPRAAEAATAHSQSMLASSQSEAATTSETPSKTYTSEEQLRLFKAVADLPRAYPGPLIPQKMYHPPTENDISRYVVNAKLLPPAYFWRGSSCGIAVIDILANRVDDMLEPNEPVLAGAGQCISVRIKWPGYRHWSKQAATMDFRKNRTPIPRSKVAKVIAKKIQFFFRDVERGEVGRKATEDPNESRRASQWAIGSNQIRLEDVILISLHNVSRGSWQPQLALRA